MELAGINIVVKDADAALTTYLKLIGTNNVAEVIKLKGLKDDSETVDGYWLKTCPLNLAIFTPRGAKGRMGEFLQKYGQGIHNIQFNMGQDEFENTYEKYKNMGWPVSRPTYYGKLSEAVFWLEESAPPGVPVKFATKAYHTLKMWPEVIYYDTPQRFEVMEIKEKIIRPRVDVKTPVVSVQDFEKQTGVWAELLSREARRKEGGDKPPVDDRRGKESMYYDIIFHIQRDQTHELWRQWEKSGFDMVDPKPLLNTGQGNGNYFFFIHPLSTHGVVCEFVSLWNFPRDKSSDPYMVFDWSDSKIFMVPPDVNEPH
jgi:hypothetical protein